MRIKFNSRFIYIDMFVWGKQRDGVGLSEKPWPSCQGL